MHYDINRTIAVVGSTGKTGSRVYRTLTKLGYQARDLSRSSERVFDWSDRSTWAHALEGTQAAYVTYYPDLAVPRAEEDIRAFVEIAKQQGVEHIVLLSGRGEEGAERAEDIVMKSGLSWNIIRASWFMQNFSESFMLEGILSGELILPIPRADEPFISVDDIADVSVAALTRRDLINQLLEITGPELLSFEQCLNIISSVLDRQVELITLSVETYIAAAKAEGLDSEIVWLLNELFTHVLDGRNEFTTNTVKQILGRPAESFADYVTRTASTQIWSQHTHPLTAQESA